MIPKVEVRVHRKIDEQQWDDAYFVFDSSSVDLSEGIEVDKDMFRISFHNANNSLANSFGNDDRVVIYFYTGASPTVSDLVFDGFVTEINYEFGSSNRRIILRGANRTYELLNSLVLIRFTDESRSVVDVIEEVLNTVNNNNLASPGDVHYIGFDSSSIAQTKEDLTAFPNKSFIANYKPAYDVIQQFSDDEYTEDGQYIFWVDSTNKFYWQKKTAITFDGDTLTEGVDFESINVQIGKFDVFNSVIMNVGRDAYGNGNHILQINTTSILQLGAKWKFIDKPTISQKLIDEEKRVNSGDFTKDAQGNFTDDHFPTSYNYDMQFQWDSDGDGLADTTTVTSDSEFNQAIRFKAKELGRQAAIAFLQLHGSPRAKAQIRVNGTLSFDKGRVIQVTSPSTNLNAKNLRVIDVSHSFTTGGWDTSLDLEEDEEDT